MGQKSIVTLICLVTICYISAAVHPKSIVTLNLMVNICDICAALHQNSKVKLEIGVATQYIIVVVQAKLAVEQFCMRFALASSSVSLT